MNANYRVGIHREQMDRERLFRQLAVSGVQSEEVDGAKQLFDSKVLTLVCALVCDLQAAKLVFARTRNWQRTVEEFMKSMVGKETIFAYRRIATTILNSHRALAEEVLGGYRAWISDSQKRPADVASSNRAEVDAKRAEIPRLKREAEKVASNLATQGADPGPSRF
jgi:hypothetical protein